MRRRLAAAAGLTLVMVLAIPGVGAVQAAAPDLRPRLVATLPTGDYGSFGESLAVAGGNRYVSLTTWSPDEVTPNEGQVWRIGPNGKLTRFGPSFDVCILGGMAFDTAGALYVANYSCDVDFARPSGVLRIGPTGIASQVLTVPLGAWPNGLALHAGQLYVSDSASGAIWRFRPNSQTNLAQAAPWLQSPLLEPTDDSSIGVNGIAFRGNSVVAVNSAAGTVVEIPVRRDGSPGTPTVVASDPSLVGADGVAFDRLGRLWVAVNTNAVVRMDLDGTVTTVIGDEGWLDYPTQAVFGGTTLFVANGSFWDGTPNVVAFDVGVAGARLP